MVYNTNSRILINLEMNLINQVPTPLEGIINQKKSRPKSLESGSFLTPQRKGLIAHYPLPIDVYSITPRLLVLFALSQSNWKS